jgi:hypothetical protein
MLKDGLGYREHGDIWNYIRLNTRDVAFDATHRATDVTVNGVPLHLSLSFGSWRRQADILNNVIITSLEESMDEAENVLAESDLHDVVENEIKSMQFFNLTKGANRDHKRN